jgi:hypothetical protein
MRRGNWIRAALFLAAPAVWGASPLYVTPDVPTNSSVSPTTMMPWQIFRYDGAGPSYTLVFTVPGNPHLDGIHKMDGVGDWLFSVEASSNLGGMLPGGADPRDVVRYDASAATYSLFFCGASLGVPPYANLDSVTLEKGDKGDLIAGFDVPTTIGAFTFDPGDLVRFTPTGAAGCAAWMLSAANPAFDASAAGAGVLRSSNVTDSLGAAMTPTVSLDVPSTLGPPGAVTYVPGQLVAWSGAAYSVYEALAGWPISSGIHGISGLANPGTVPTTITLGKAPAGDIIVNWAASCADGATDYGIYEGTIGTWYSHTLKDCNDAGGDRTEQITPAAGNRYYLVVANNFQAEGSYGQATSGAERPVGTAVCITPQVVTACPP